MQPLDSVISWDAGQIKVPDTLLSICVDHEQIVWLSIPLRPGDMPVFPWEMDLARRKDERNMGLQQRYFQQPNGITGLCWVVLQ